MGSGDGVTGVSVGTPVAGGEPTDAVASIVGVDATSPLTTKMSRHALGFTLKDFSSLATPRRRTRRVGTGSLQQYPLGPYPRDQEHDEGNEP